MSDCLHRPALYSFDTDFNGISDKIWFISCVKCKFRGRLSEDANTAIIYWQNEPLILDDFNDKVFDKFVLVSNDNCMHDECGLTLCECGWLCYCIHCKMHTPIVDSMEEAKRLWSEGLILNINEHTATEYIEFKKVFYTIKFNISYIKEFWQLMIKRKSSRKSIIKDIATHLKNLYTICRNFESGLTVSQDTTIDVSEPTSVNVEIEQITSGTMKC